MTFGFVGEHLCAFVLVRIIVTPVERKLAVLVRFLNIVQAVLKDLNVIPIIIAAKHGHLLDFVLAVQVNLRINVSSAYREVLV